MKKKLRIHFIGMSQDHHSRLKTISLAPFALKAYVDRYLGKEFPNVIETQASDFFWDTSPEEIVSSIDIKDVDLLCFSIYTWNVAELIETSKIFKRKKKNVIIALGGPEVAAGSAESHGREPPCRFDTVYPFGWRAHRLQHRQGSDRRKGLEYGTGNRL